MIAGLAILPGMAWAQYPMPLPPESRVFPSSTTSEAPGVPHNINKATKILGMTLRNQDREKLGVVRDLIIDTKSQRVAYAWVERSGSSAPSDRFVAVPFDLMQSRQNQRSLVLSVDKTTFDTAKGYAVSQLPNMALPRSEVAFWRTISETAGAQPQTVVSNRPPWPYRK